MERARGDDPELLQRVSRWYERHAILPERAAARIIRAIENGTPRLVITPEAAFGDLLKRLFPVMGNKIFVDVVIRAIGVGDMRAKRIAQWRDTMTKKTDHEA